MGRSRPALSKQNKTNTRQQLMARTIGPLLSLEARGQFASTLGYAITKGRQITKLSTPPSNPNSPRQQTQRAMVRFLGANWRVFKTAPIEASWTAAAAAENTTEFLEYSRCNLNRWAQLQAPTQSFPAAGSGSKQTWSAAPDAQGGVKAINIAWRVNQLNQGWGMIIYLAATPGSSLTNTSVVAIERVKTGLTNFWIAGIAPGLYWVNFASFSTSGLFFAQDLNKFVVVT